MSAQLMASAFDHVATLVDDDVVRRFRDEGVVLVRQALHREWLQLIEMGLARVLGDSSVTKHRFFAGMQGEFQETVRNFDSSFEIRRLMYDSPIADMLGRCMNSTGVWYYSDEFFIKDAGGCERTPWHQDTPYFPVAGSQLASAWISLDRLRADECLEFVQGTHRSTLYDGFDPRHPGDPSESYYKQGLPKLPDIQANRSAFPIVSWDIEPGDMIISSPSTIHGGGPTRIDGRRRAIAIRMFGDDVVFATRPPSMPTVPMTPGLSQRLKPGDPLRSPWYPQLRPVPVSERWGS